MDERLDRVKNEEVLLASRMTEVTEKERKINQRTTQIEVSEKVVAERQEQLFKAYDALTEKIFMFERECDNLRSRKR